MKEYCVDLEIAKELKENGFHQDTNFYWYKRLPEKNSWKFIGNKNVQYKRKSYCFTPDGNDILYSAPCSDEVLKELPTYFIENKEYYLLEIRKDIYTDIPKSDFYCISYTHVDGTGYREICIEADKLSNALAIMWLYLKKEGYIK